MNKNNEMYGMYFLPLGTIIVGLVQVCATLMISFLGYSTTPKAHHVDPVSDRVPSNFKFFFQIAFLGSISSESIIFEKKSSS